MIKNGKIIIRGGRIVRKRIIKHTKRINAQAKRFRRNVKRHMAASMPSEEIIMKHRKDIEEEAMRFRKDMQKNIATAILAAFAFIIALVWKDAIQESVDKLLKVLNLTGTGYLYRVFTAIFVTVICVFGMMQISKWAESEKKDEDKGKK